MLASENKVSFYRYRKKGSIKFFKMEENLLFRDNIGLITIMGKPYILLEWRLFIDSSKRSMKCILLRNGNKLAFIPIGHSIQMKETYENIKTILDRIKYVEYEWIICGDLNIFIHASRVTRWEYKKTLAFCACGIVEQSKITR